MKILFLIISLLYGVNASFAGEILDLSDIDFFNKCCKKALPLPPGMTHDQYLNEVRKKVVGEKEKIILSKEETEAILGFLKNIPKKPLSAELEATIRETIEEQIVPYKEKLNNVKIITFRKDNINSTIFNYITEILLPLFQAQQKDRKYLSILDLSQNHLDENSFTSLKKWLNFNEALYIDVTNNPVDNKDINKIYYKFVEDFEKAFQSENPSSTSTSSSFINALNQNTEIPNFMRQFIFVSKQYLWDAQNRVKIYKTLVDLKVIPENWVKIHKQYYALPEKKYLEEFIDEKEIVKCMKKMKQLSFEMKIHPNIKVQDKDKQTVEEENVETIDLDTAIRVTSPLRIILES